MTKETFTTLKNDVSKELLMLREDFNFISENAEVNEENYSLIVSVQRLISQINNCLLFIDSPDGEKKC